MSSSIFINISIKRGHAEKFATACQGFNSRVGSPRGNGQNSGPRNLFVSLQGSNNKYSSSDTSKPRILRPARGTQETSLVVCCPPARTKTGGGRQRGRERERPVQLRCNSVALLPSVSSPSLHNHQPKREKVKDLF